MPSDLRRMPLRLRPESDDNGRRPAAADVPAVSVTDLRVAYGRTVAVHDVSLAIPVGGCFGLLGPNGAGKTSLMHAIAGIVPPTSGRITFAESRAVVGIAPQEIALYPQLSAHENLRFVGSLYGLRGRALKRRIDDVLEFVGLAEHGLRRVEQYSGGMMRRLNFAAAIIHEPSLLLLDEPTLGVDPQSRAFLLDYVAAQARTAATVLYTTHYMEEAERLCDRVAIINEGRIVDVGTPSELALRVQRPVLRAQFATDLSDEDLEVLGARPARSARELLLEVDSIDEGLARIHGWSNARGLSLIANEILTPSLESVFLQLTGRDLRDEPEARASCG